jgi:hypothetical protein
LLVLVLVLLVVLVAAQALTPEVQVGLVLLYL